MVGYSSQKPGGLEKLAAEQHCAQLPLGWSPQDPCFQCSGQILEWHCIRRPQQAKQINQSMEQTTKKIQILSLIIPVLLKFLDPHCGMCGKIPSCQRPLRPMHAAGQGWGWGHSRCVSWISSQMFSKRVMENVCTPGQTAVQSPLTALRSKPVMLLERECYPT